MSGPEATARRLAARGLLRAARWLPFAAAPGYAAMALVSGAASLAGSPGCCAMSARRAAGRDGADVSPEGGSPRVALAEGGGRRPRLRSRTAPARYPAGRISAAKSVPIRARGGDQSPRSACR